MEMLQEGLDSILSLSSDIVIAFILVACAGIFVYLKGKRRGVALIFSFYPALLLFESLPFLKEYTTSAPSTSGEAWIRIALFGILLVIAYFILNPFISIESSYSKMKRVTESTILGGMIAGLLLLALHQVADIRPIYTFSQSISGLFTASTYFWWLAAPFALLFFIRR